MRALTLDAIRRDPGLLQTLHADARRMRAESVHRLLAALLGPLESSRHSALRQQRPEALRTACCT